MRPGKKVSVPSARSLAERAAVVASTRGELGVLVFTLDSRLPFVEVTEHLAEQFAELALTSRVVAAGPDRVQAVLDGKFAGIDVVIALGETAENAEDQLMELVNWLLANGRTALAENLIYAQLGHERTSTVAPTFNRVLLPRAYFARTRQSGLRLPWAASAHDSWELAEAVLDYAAGLGDE